MNAQQLRNSILQQAIQGKLVPQDPADEPASVLLQRIRKEKERLVKEGNLKKKDLESKPIEEDEIPFEIPESWEWCRIVDISACELGKALDAVRNTGEYVDYLTGINVYWNRFDFSQMRKMRMTSVEYSKYHLIKGDLVVCEGGDAGRCAVWGSDKTIAFQKALHRVRFYDRIHSSFYMYLMMIYRDTGILEPYITGTTIKHLTNVQLRGLIIPLPPLAEQRRIVAKIEELMPLVERYGKAQEALDQLNESLPARLRQSILQEAIQGRLVPQDPKEESASELLKRIRKEKEQLVKEGKLKKKDLESKPIDEDEIPFEIPESWEWVRYKDIANCELGKTKNPNEPIENLCPYLCSINVYWNKIDLSILKEMPFTEKEKEKYSIKKGDMLICEGGEAGRTAIWQDDKTTVYYQNALHRVRFYSGIDPKFYMYQMHVYKTSGYLHDYINGETIQHFVLSKLQILPVPLPSLSEQKRIVAKIEELFGVMG